MPRRLVAAKALILASLPEDLNETKLEVVGTVHLNLRDDATRDVSVFVGNGPDMSFSIHRGMLSQTT
jgi:hypothetical protein